MSFPNSSGGKESACNAGDPSSIPGSGRSLGEGIGYPFQYFGASFVAQLVKNLPAMWEIWIQSLGWEYPLEKGTVTHSQYSGLENSMDWIVHVIAKSWIGLSNFHFHHWRYEITQLRCLPEFSSVKLLFPFEINKKFVGKYFETL